MSSFFQLQVLLMQLFDLLQSILCLLLKALTHSIDGIKAPFSKFPPLIEMICVRLFRGLQFFHCALAVVPHVLSMISDQTFAGFELTLELFN